MTQAVQWNSLSSHGAGTRFAWFYCPGAVDENAIASSVLRIKDESKKRIGQGLMDMTPGHIVPYDEGHHAIILSSFWDERRELSS